MRTGLTTAAAIAIGAFGVVNSATANADDKADTPDGVTAYSVEADFEDGERPLNPT